MPTALDTFTPESIDIPSDRLLRMQGYKTPDAVRRAIRRAADVAAKLAQDVILPRVYYRKFDVRQCENGVLELVTDHCFRCPAFPKYLTGCHQVIAFVQTLGQPFDDRIEQLMAEDDLLGVLFLDNAGWLAIEATSTLFARHLKSQPGSSGQRLTRRLGPGYSYRSNRVLSQWDLTEQAILFDLFKRPGLPVTLLDSCAMLPRMSRSGIYGLQDFKRSVEKG